MSKKVFRFALCALLFAFSFPAHAQQPKRIPRIGILAIVPAPQHDAFQQGLRDLGYVEGENIIIERRYAMGIVTSFPRLQPS